MKMFKFIQGLLLSIALTLSLAAQSQNLSGTSTGGVKLLSTDGVRLYSMQFVDTSGANNQVVIYDNDSASSTNRVRPAYTARTTYLTNVVMTFTNFAGVVQSSTNQVLASVTSSVSASTNEATAIYRITVPANSQVLFQPTSPYGTTYGLQYWSTSNLSYNASLSINP